MAENSGVATSAHKLDYFEFQAKYGRGERAYEYWFGEALPKGRPTWIHGLLQGILLRLLSEAGYKAASEVELRIAPDARPRPDVIATSGEIKESYPTKAVDVVVEILSEDDPMPYILEKCEAYRGWGFKFIYVLNPERRQLFRWTGTALETSDLLTSVRSSRIWNS